MGARGWREHRPDVALSVRRDSSPLAPTCDKRGGEHTGSPGAKEELLQADHLGAVFRMDPSPIRASPASHDRARRRKRGRVVSPLFPHRRFRFCLRLTVPPVVVVLQLGLLTMLVMGHGLLALV